MTKSNFISGKSERYRAWGAAAGVATITALGIAGCGLVASPLDRGRQALAEGDLETAKTQLSNAIERDENPPLALAYRCMVHDMLGDQTAAVRDCTAALEAAGDGPIDGITRHEILNNRAVARIGLRDYDGALEDLDQALDLEPDYAEAYANRGRVHTTEQRYEEAIRDLDRAIELNPEMSQAFGNRGYAYQSLGDDVNAIADYTRAIEIDDNYEAYYNRATINYALGNFREAYLDYRAVAREAGEGSYLGHVSKTQAEVLALMPGVADEGEATQGSGDGEELSEDPEQGTGDASSAPAEVIDGGPGDGHGESTGDGEDDAQGTTGTDG